MCQVLHDVSRYIWMCYDNNIVADVLSRYDLSDAAMLHVM